MRHHFVEQQQRREARHRREQLGVRQHQPDQQRLLLAGRCVGGRDRFRRVDHSEIGEMRTVERAAGGGVPRLDCPAARRGSAPRPRPRDGPATAARSSRRARSPRRGRRRPCAPPARPAGAARFPRAAPRPRPRAPRFRARWRQASADPARASSSSRLRERSARSSALTRVGCPASTASTRRSRKRRRSEAGPANSWSIAGVSHTTRR